MEKRMILRLAFLFCLVASLAAGVFWLFNARLAGPARAVAPMMRNASAAGPGDGSLTLARPPFLK